VCRGFDSFSTTLTTSFNRYPLSQFNHTLSGFLSQAQEGSVADMSKGIRILVPVKRVLDYAVSLLPAPDIKLHNFAATQRIPNIPSSNLASNPTASTSPASNNHSIPLTSSPLKKPSASASAMPKTPLPPPSPTSSPSRPVLPKQRMPSAPL
jgi:hypothetical protein